jgi:glutamyl-tRNA synthetase
LPEAFINLLATLGWNDGSDQEIFTIEELVEKFSIERVHKGGAKFDFEKAKWFNAEWIKKSEAESLKPEVRRILEDKGISVTDEGYLLKGPLCSVARLLSPGGLLF